MLLVTLWNWKKVAVSENTHSLVIEHGEIELGKDLEALSFLDRFPSAEMCYAHYRVTVAKLSSCWD